MKIQISTTTNDAESMTERTYTYKVDLPDTVTMEAMEAHARSILRILDIQAHSTEDDEDDESWKTG